MKYYLILCSGLLLFTFTNCAKPLPDMSEESSSTLATNPTDAGLTGGFGTPGETVNPPLIAPTPTETVVTPPIVSAPAEDNSTTTLHRFFNIFSGQHFMSGSTTEVGVPWTLDQTQHKVFNTSYAHRHPLYRCYIADTDGHFSSNDSNCEGYIFEGQFGYLENNPTTVAGRPWHRCYSELYGHIDTANPQECTNNGFRVEGILGYMP